MTSSLKVENGVLIWGSWIGSSHPEIGRKLYPAELSAQFPVESVPSFRQLLKGIWHPLKGPTTVLEVLWWGWETLEFKRNPISL